LNEHEDMNYNFSDLFC